MSSTLRPDNLKAALDAKVAAGMAQLAEVREMEQPRLTPHLNPREIVGAFLLYARGIFPMLRTFGSTQAGELQFNAWYEQWVKALSDADRALWKQLGDDHGAGLTDVEISAVADPSVAPPASSSGARPDVRKRIVRFAAYANRPASNVCGDYLRLARVFIHDFLRDHARFLH